MYMITMIYVKSYSPMCYPENVTVHYYKHSSMGGVYVLHIHVNLNVTNYISSKLLQQKAVFYLVRIVFIVYTPMILSTVDTPNRATATLKPMKY